MLTVQFDRLATSDLVIDAVYEGGALGHMGDDPIHPLVGVGLLGGFRYVGAVPTRKVKLCVLYSELTDPDWPDALHPETGQFMYYGDNKSPGNALHDTPRSGNLFLRNVFEDLHTGNRERIPPILVFTKGSKGRDVVFRGLAVPGVQGISQTEDLVAIWKTKKGERFQNYRALFTILDVANINRAWLDSIHAGNSAKGAPKVWTSWIKDGVYRPLRAPRTLQERAPSEQLPSDPERLKLLVQIVDYFKSHEQREYAFEQCAADIIARMDGNVVSVDLTRPWRDGGRDAMGRYRIGTKDSDLLVDFALEAKCKRPAASNTSGVRDTSRLISRLRHRQFGVFVTTSCLNLQAYREILEDGHPVLILSGVDIMEILFRDNLNTAEKIRVWLRQVAP